MYILLADDTEDGYDVFYSFKYISSHIKQIFFFNSFHTDADWEPKLFQYQQTGANVLFFTFINPETMIVPESFKKLGKDKM